MGSRGQSKQKKYASEDRRQREDAKREGARRGAKYYEYTDRKGNTTTGETGNERARGGTYRAKFDEDVVRYANMSPEELERERDRLKNESDTANWGITRAAASRTASAVDQAAAADTQIARINQVLRRQSAAAQRARERAEKRQATRETNKLPAGVRVTFPDGTTRIYARGPGGSVVDQRGLPVESVGNMSYRDLYNRMASNSSGGFRFENVSSADVRRMQDDYNKSLRDTTDYELGVGVPWGNREYRQGARRNRLANRSQKRRG